VGQDAALQEGVELVLHKLRQIGANRRLSLHSDLRDDRRQDRRDERHDERGHAKNKEKKGKAKDKHD
jgi:hypothetical protein